VETLLATSLVPGTRQEVQQAAVNSWIDCGFSVQSLNTEKEAAAVQTEFPTVEAHVMLRDARIATGRPVIFINDILQFFRNSGSDICGIINSDIYLAGGQAFHDQVASLAREGHIILPRLEVPDFSSSTGQLDPFGYDFFMFDRTLLADWNESQFCLGMPFWDHWFPMMSLLAGRKVLKIVSRNVRHIPHPVSRDDSFFMFNDHFAGLMIGYMENNTIGFGNGFDFSPYQQLREAVVSAESVELSPTERQEAITALALFFDGLTKYVIKFIDDRTEKVEL